MLIQKRHLFGLIGIILFMALQSIQSTILYGQVDTTIRRKNYIRVLRAEQVGKVFVFDYLHREDCNKSYAVYLGRVVTKKGKVYKILNSLDVFHADLELPCHGTDATQIYNDHNQIIGYYHTIRDEEPIRVEDNCLIFKDPCTKGVAKISLRSGLPKEIHLKCSDLADIYFWRGDYPY